jgi:hypothetical protein
MFSPAPHADEPWSLRVADVKTGMAKQIGRPTPATAARSRRWSPTASCIGAPAIAGVPVGEGRLAASVFRARSGGKATLLTPGNFEVEYVDITANGAKMIYNSNQDGHRSSACVDGAGRWLSEAVAHRDEIERQRMAGGDHD